MSKTHLIREMPYYELRFLPVLEEGNLPRYKLNCERDEGTEEISPNIVRAAVSMLADFLSEGQESYAALTRLWWSSSQSLPLWRDRMADRVGELQASMGPTLLVRDANGLPCAAVTYKMCRSELDFCETKDTSEHTKSPNGKAGDTRTKTILTGIPRLHPAGSPSSAVTWTCYHNELSDEAEVAIASALLVARPQREACTRALSRLMEDGTSNGQLSAFGSPVESGVISWLASFMPDAIRLACTQSKLTDEDTLSAAWTMTVGGVTQDKLLAHPHANAALWGPLERGFLSTEGEARLKESLISTVEDLKTACPTLENLTLEITTSSQALQQMLT